MNIFSALGGGGRRSIGRANAVAAFVLENRAALPKLLSGLSHPDPVVCVRAADAAEKVSVQYPEWFDPFVMKVLDATRSDLKEVRWHAAQMLSRVKLSPKQRSQAVAWLFQSLKDESKIVRVSALTALAELAIADAALRRAVAPCVARAAHSRSPSMRARAKKLLRRFGSQRRCERGG
jgi:hypothetical protein